MEEITPDTNDCEDIVERRTDAEQPRESTGNEDFKVCEKVIETQTNGDPELREIILSLSKKCCDLEENVNEMKKIAAEKNKDLFDLITYQGGEIYKRDQKIRQLEDTLAEKEAIIRNLRGGRQIATREVVDSQPTVDESIDNPVYEEMEEMPVLAAENNLEEIEDQPGSSSGKSREDVERPTRRGRPRKSGTIKIFETRQSAGPVLEAQKSGEMTPKAKKRSLQLIKKERESENKENDQTTSNQRKSPRFRGKTTTPDSEKKKADNDGPPSLPKVKRQRMVEHRDDDKPPMLFAEAEPMTNLNDEDEAEKILRSCQWLRHIAYNFKTGEVYCSLTGQPLTSEQMNLAVERVILLLKLHDNLTAISVLISLEGWALKSPPNVEQVNDAMARLENAGLLKEKGEVYEKIKETEDMKQFKRALAQRGLRLKEYHRVFNQLVRLSPLLVVCRSSRFGNLNQPAAGSAAPPWPGAMKEEIIDDDYDRAILGPSSRKRPSSAETEESILVAKRIKQELGMDDDEPQEIIVRRLVRAEPPPPIVFDHFICMRIGLNSENNVQRLMAVLSAHNFVDLTVIPGPSILPSVIAAAPAPSLIQFAEPSSSRPVTREVEELPTRHAPKKYAPRRQPGDNLPGIPTLLKCTKCNEVMGTGATCNSILAHVQKFHLKMAAFQCRICKHYRTTQERIQSHVTTVHKARSTSFDDTLAGPISEQDMVQMEKMINTCFPEITVKLEITDRLSVKSFLIKKNSSKR